VLVDRDIATFPKRSELVLVTYDNRRAGYLVTDHMIQRGCKRILFVGASPDSTEASDRMCGYYDALDENGLTFDPSPIPAASLHEIDGAVMRGIIEKSKPDGIVCETDPCAAIVGRHLTEMNLKIGKEILLAGFDDEPIAQMLPVPLTTVRFPLEPFAQVCYDRLLKVMENPQVPNPGLTVIDVELVVRGSTSGPLSHVRMGEG
jgi:DNA-binding LacI/PurR family transcriptional regulator